ncbi:DUF2145 domain-containing protein [Massilia sp. IC2-477]|uniref:DUF2145 domain-containing protein n=1 Tax=unclassified Massilia TaxID=2609279 RepID=UPI001D101851|nr:MULTISPECIES: DUF2145 domain-containing protein [unclassified Massilia]MCC2957457.1 DUF2145 domain-containing protein [Massilia sp. IC2-477]MCC2973851.1 DUF2145 domain-containing protein [Massilia sp. IC2-476]
MRPLLAAALLGALAATVPAHAGQPCEERPLAPHEVVLSMDLAQRTVQALEASGAQVALVSRAGQDLSKYRLRYSHMGIVVRDHPAGRWIVVHELNDCGSASSALYNEGMGNFFLTDLYRFEAQLVIPGPEMGAKLAKLVATRTPVRLHEPNYNMLSYVYSTRYQNSNQWVLENLAAAFAPAGQVETRLEAQKWLRSIGFQPPTVEVPAAVRLGARMFRANVAFDDHPFERRMAGQIDTVTTDAVVRMLRMVDPQAKTLTVD